MNAAGNCNVSLLLEQLAKKQASRAALIDTGNDGLRVASFGDLEAEVCDAAKILREAGVRSLDTVLIYVPLQRELISLLLAVFRIGAQALFIDPSYGPKKIIHCLSLAKPKFLIIDGRLKPLTVVAPLFGIRGVIIFTGSRKSGIRDGLVISRSTKNDNHSDAAIQEVAAEHPALITFTSGSTGKPKGIVRSHGFLINQAALLEKTLPPAQADKADKGRDGLNVMTTLPMFILAALASGQTSIIPAANADKLLHQLRYLGIDRLLCAPHSLQNICKLLVGSRVSLPHLKQVIVGGGPVFPGLLDEIKAVMPMAEITTVYGSTEAEPICHRALKANKLQVQERGLPLGRPIDEITLCIVDPRVLGQRHSLTQAQFDAIKQPALKDGEIVVSGRHVIGGYLLGLGDEETKFEVDGRIFHRTGDAGYLNNQGDVFLTGRVAFGIANGADTIYPLAVELMAMDNEAVDRCAFVSVRGKSVLALKLKSGHENVTVLARLKETFEAANVAIDKYVVVNTLPLDERHQSKIVYSRLKRQLRSAS